MKRFLLSGSAIAALTLCSAPLSRAAVVLSHDFVGAGPLNGSAATLGSSTWSAGPVFSADGTVGRVNAGSADGQAAHLAFTPETGKIYTLTATITNTTADWIGFGFMAAGSSAVFWEGQGFDRRHSNSGAHAWVLTRNNPSGNDQEGFNGANTANGAFGGDIASPLAPLTISILLNTEEATWTAQYLINGEQQGGTFNLPASAVSGADAIGGIGFSRTNFNGPGPEVGTISSLSLTVIPEPSAALLGALGGLGLLRRRRA